MSNLDKEVYSEVEASGHDLEVIDSVADYLENNYMRPLGQGPLWVTGSAVYGSDPNDYDLVLERSFRDTTLSDENDYRVIASMMRDLSEDERFEDYRENETVDSMDGKMVRSDQVDISNSVNLRPDPIHRFEIDIEDVPLDIVFRPDKPDYGVKIK